MDTRQIFSTQTMSININNIALQIKQHVTLLRPEMNWFW